MCAVFCGSAHWIVLCLWLLEFILDYYYLLPVVAPNNVCHSFYCWSSHWVFFGCFVYDQFCGQLHTHAAAASHRAKSVGMIFFFRTGGQRIVRILLSSVFNKAQRRQKSTAAMRKTKQSISIVSKKNLSRIQCAPERNVKYAFNCLQLNCKMPFASPAYISENPRIK